MPIISLRNVSKFYDGLAVLSDVTFEIHPGARIGLIGENGSGKSTLLKILSGDVAPDGGQVVVSRSSRIRRLPQILDPMGQRSAPGEGPRAKAPPDRPAGEEALQDAPPDLPAWEEALQDAPEGMVERWQAEEVLLSQGLLESQVQAPLGVLSGGERAKVAMARALLSQADLLLLDEPDQHLDLAGLRWCEDRLRRCQGGFILVSHDREFLERVTDSTLEIEDGRVILEKVGYAEYLARKATARAKQEQAYRDQQKALKAMKEAIRAAEEKARHIEGETIDFHYRKRALKVARRATTLKARLERELEGEAKVEKPASPRLRVRLGISSGRSDPAPVLSLQGVRLRLREPAAPGHQPSSNGPRPDAWRRASNGRTLLGGVDLLLRRGQKLALVGSNGSGKTTLMEIALGLRTPDAGEIWRAASAKVFYCDQRLGGLEPERTVYQTIEDATSLERNAIHHLIARILLPREACHRPVRLLSGGERTRLVLAILVHTHADCLLLDEPTHHLDLPSMEVLQEALNGYTGALWFISHDRRLVKEVATDVLELRDGELHRAEGDWLGAG